ncbi:hypothetical protein CHCC20335_2574 [Bacillus paralicheniformis]|nr:hypothetical protein CHCC20335_2574 [Bacillus paralicheniformis]
MKDQTAQKSVRPAPPNSCFQRKKLACKTIFSGFAAITSKNTEREPVQLTEMSADS